MKKILAIAILILCGYHLFAQETDIKKETELIKKTIQSAYVEGLQNEGDTVKINRGFHPAFEMLMPMKDGYLKRYAIKEWKDKIKADVKAGKLPRKSDSRISVKFLNVDVTGTVAVAKFEFYVAGKLTFIDYLSLIKFGDDWKIVSKIYYKL
jgi:hypothetical protein